MRKALIFIVLICIALCLSQCNIILYGVGQGIGQLKIIRGAEPIDKILASEETPDSIKKKLILIQEIREYAIDSLGLLDSDSYHDIYDQKGEPVLWVVSASPPFKMEEYKWKYPFLGELGYKGYFKEEKAINELQRLKEEGFDTDISEVNAWSTLGFFDDPILSNMLSKSEGELARLIIHELTHATVYIKSDADYNENLATFIGDQGAIQFMEDKYGSNSKEYNKYVEGLNDIEKVSAHMLIGANQLDSLYGLIKNMSEIEKYKIKEGFIATIIDAVDTLTLFDKSRISHLKSTNFKPNNTYFMTYKMYRAQQSDFQDEFETKFNSKFKSYIAHLIEKYSR